MRNITNGKKHASGPTRAKADRRGERGKADTKTTTNASQTASSFPRRKPAKPAACVLPGSESAMNSQHGLSTASKCGARQGNTDKNDCRDEVHDEKDDHKIPNDHQESAQERCRESILNQQNKTCEAHEIKARMNQQANQAHFLLSVRNSSRTSVGKCKTHHDLKHRGHHRNDQPNLNHVRKGASRHCVP